MSDTLRVTRIQKFCTHDGPGIRTVVFLKGCPLRCEWCHNPETQSAQNQLMYSEKLCIGCGACAEVCRNAVHGISEQGHCVDFSKCSACGVCAEVCPTGACEMAAHDMTIRELIREIEKDRAFYGEDGGLTVSGGEPMLHPHECMELLKTSKLHGIGTAIETCGFFDSAWIPTLLENTDIFLWDFKDSDEERHIRYTGVSNRKILENLRMLNGLGAKIILRCILVNGVNTNDAHYSAIAHLRDSLTNCVGVDLLPFHAYGSSKAMQMGYAYIPRREWIPTEEQLRQARKILNIC